MGAHKLKLSSKLRAARRAKFNELKALKLPPDGIYIPANKQRKKGIK